MHNCIELTKMKLDGFYHQKKFPGIGLSGLLAILESVLLPCRNDTLDKRASTKIALVFYHYYLGTTAD